MPSTPSTNPKTPTSDAQPVVAPGLEEQLQQFWGKYRQAILAGVAVLILAVLVNEGIRFFRARREQAIESEYAAVNTPEKRRAFISEHPDHALAGVAHLTLADEAYAAGNFSAAQQEYEKAASIITQPLLSGRARLGLAISFLQGGQAAKAQDQLQKIATDATLPKGLRCEATYDLASLAFDAGKFDEVQKLSNDMMQIDQANIWAQRIMQLRSQAPAPSVSVAPAPAGK